MKRRNGDLPKLRRPVKKNKITDGIYGSSVVYLKFFILWALVLLADFLLEFRFEFLWPFWLLLRSVYDSYKYQGLAFSVFFVSIALTSDMICYFFIPVQWLFFAASTYVWVQYVWHTEKGICWPTVLLWVGFAYMEAAVRLKDLRHMPFHLDLCRPFAAHCIGYPVVTLGFGFKSYVSFRIRQRRQREVRKENGFYMNLLSQALPIEALQSDPAVSPDKSKGESNGVGYHGPTSAHGSGKSGGHRKSMDKGQVVEPYTNGSVHQDFELSDKSKLNGTAVKTKQNSSSSSLVSPFRMLCFRSSRVVSPELEEEESPVNTSSDLTNSTSNDSKEGATSINSTVGPGGDKVRNATKGRNSGGARGGQSSLSLKKNRLNRDVQSTPAAPLQSPSDPAQEYCQRLESDVKRFKSEITQLRQSESDLKSQLSSAGTSEKSVRAELATLRHHHDDIQTKLQNLMTCRTADQKSISSLEKRLNEEKRLRSCAESALAQERKANKQAQQQHHQQQQLQQQQQQLHVQKASLAVGGPTWGLSSPHMDRNCLPVGECCNDCCRQRRRDLENEIKNLRRDLKAKEGKCATADREIQNLIQYKENQPGAEVLMKALNILQDKNSHLENSLSAETRIKLDLFSALGDAKRHLEIRDNVIRSKDHEIEELKTKLAQVLAVMPAASEFLSVTSQQHPLLSNSPVSLSNSLAMSASGLGGGGGGGRLPKLRPMPMASDQSPSSSSSSSSSLVISPVTPSLLLRTSSPQQIQQQTSSSIMVTSPSSILAPNHHHHHQNGSTGPSNLDPNAGVYTPKPSRLVSEA